MNYTGLGNKLREYLLGSMLLLLTTLGWGRQQNYYFETIGREEGLSHNMVYDLIQDKQGFIWAATKKGLNRYDGTSFKVFMKEPKTANGLTDDTFYSLVEDREGTIWAGTAKGLFTYSPVTERFTDVELRGRDGNVVRGAVRSLITEPSGNIWIAMSDTCVFRMTFERRSTCYSLRKYLSPEGKIRSLCVDSDGNLWIATLADGLFRLNYSTGVAENFKYGNGSKKENDFTKIIAFDGGSLLVGTKREGILYFSLKTHKFEQIPGIAETVANGSGGVLDIYKDSGGDIYAGTENGLYLYSENKLRYFIHDRNDKYSITGGGICAILKDREGGIWVGTYYGGLCHYSLYKSQFEKYYPTSGKDGELSGQNIRQFCNDGQGGLFVGTEDGGLYRLNLKDKEFRHLLPEVKTVNAVKLIGGQIYIGTENDGLFTCDPYTLKITHLSASSSIPERMIHSICGGRDGQLWIGTDTGLYLCRNDKVQSINEHNIRSIVHDILEDSDGNLWVATEEDGVYKFNTKIKSWQNYALSEIDASGNASAICILEDRSGDVWVGTEGSGIYYYDHIRSSFSKHYSTANGLPDAIVYSLVEDSEGKLWGSSSHGVFCFDPLTEEVENFDTRNGLPFDQFNYNSGLLCEDGKIYFGGVEGFTAFDPLHIKAVPYTPTLVFNYFRLAGEEVKVGAHGSPLEKSITLAKKVTLHPEQKNFSIGFTDLMFSPSPETTFLYKIEDLDDHWSEVSKSQILTFSNLPIGNHTLTIRARHPSTSEGIERSIIIKVLPPWYRTTLAYILYVIVCLAALCLGGKHIVRRIRKRNDKILSDLNLQKERELYNSKIDFFTRLTSEFRTPLTLIASPLGDVLSRIDKASPEYTTLSIVKRNANKMVKLINDLLNFRKIEDTHSLNYLHTNLSDKLREIVSQFPVQAYSHDIDINLQITPEGLEADIDREIFTKIINNILSNALESAKSRVNISTELTCERNFRVHVSNDGPRIPKNLTEKIFDPFVKINPSTRGIGIGLPFARNLAESHGGRLFLSQNGEPVEFTLELPLSQESAIGSIEDNFEANATLRSRKEENFSNELTKFIDEHMDDPELDVEKIAKGLCLSTPTLYRRLKSISELTPNDFVKLCRLKKAATLLQEREYKINEIAYIVGFSSSSYFSKCFYKQFGVLPKDVNKDTDIPDINNKH